MTINYKTNGAYCTKSLTEWYFGKTFVKKATDRPSRTTARPASASTKHGRTAPAT